MDKLFKEQAVLLLIVIAVVAGGCYGAYYTFGQFNENLQRKTTQQNDLQVQEEALQKRKAEIAASQVKEEKKEETSSGKVIYEVSGQQFTPEASFGIMFENLLSNITNSGVKIRSIEYNYGPDEDKILSSGEGGGYNACELSFVTVSTYAQFQNLIKNIAKAKYLSSIHEIYIEPFDRDKKILITKFKIRLYTKTVS